MGFGTDCIHAGQSSEPTTGSVTVPVFQTSTYEQQGIGQHLGYEYARTQNPTREAFERCVAALEKADHGIAFASGLAAIGTITQLLSSGDHVVCTNNVYGGTYRVFDQLYRRLGIRFDFVDSSDLANIESAWSDDTKMLFIESPTNPVLGVTDLAGAAKIARSRGAFMVVDNTFMSPCLQRPIEHGADVVVHSTTKYINGHSDMVGGIVATSDESIHERLRFLQNAAGAVPGPWDCWLALRGIKTLHVRMREHEKNARAMVDMLKGHDAIEKLYYPGLESHPGHELAKRQQDGFGAMISFDVGSIEKAQKVVQMVKVFTLAESLGGVESLISHPAAMTHAAVPKADRDAMGVTDGLVRLSVGIEDADDLIADVRSALEAIA
jgi:cystathionine beta-lyase/cystathionine gamma-synthase